MMEADNGLFISIDPGCASNKDQLLIE